MSVTSSVRHRCSQGATKTQFDSLFVLRISMKLPPLAVFGKAIEASG
jgi:hypothetical protein